MLRRMGVRANPPVVEELPDEHACTECGRQCAIRYRLCYRCSGQRSPDPTRTLMSVARRGS